MELPTTHYGFIQFSTKFYWEPGYLFSVVAWTNVQLSYEHATYFASLYAVFR